LFELFQKGGENMAKVEKSVTIKANVEKVFDFMADPRNLPEVWPSMVEVRDVQPSPTGRVQLWLDVQDGRHAF
jgi:uncharacterized protein YndB with AHSA1/START domain